MTRNKLHAAVPRKALLVAVMAGLGAAMAGPALAQTDTSEPAPHSNGVGAAITDTAITAKVKAKLLDDKRLKNAHIQVTTTNGVVALNGTAPTSEAKDAAAEVTKSVDGVKSVDNQIQSPSLADDAAGKVNHAAKKTGKAVSDTWITTKVKSQLMTDSSIHGDDVSVKTRNGVVTLTGTAQSQQDIDNIKTLVQSVDGVKSVDTAGLKTK
jgi:hyperosmotically inducible protein